MFSNAATLCVAAGLSAAIALAQSSNPPDPQSMIQMRVSFMTAQLKLTDTQKASATTIFTDSYTAGQTAQTSLQTNRQSLSAAVKKNDTAAIDSLAAVTGTLVGQLTAINSKADAAFYAILTTDQKAAYDAMPHGGPGGGPGPLGHGGFFPSRRPPEE